MHQCSLCGARVASPDVTTADSIQICHLCHRKINSDSAALADAEAATLPLQSLAGSDAEIPSDSARNREPAEHRIGTLTHLYDGHPEIRWVSGFSQVLSKEIISGIAFSKADVGRRFEAAADREEGSGRIVSLTWLRWLPHTNTMTRNQVAEFWRSRTPPGR